jgi:hypothetical protein
VGDFVAGCADDDWVNANVMIPIAATPRVAIPATRFGTLRAPFRVSSWSWEFREFIVLPLWLWFGTGTTVESHRGIHFSIGIERVASGGSLISCTVLTTGSSLSASMQARATSGGRDVGMVDAPRPH